jgi:Ca-activated chloride channel family protein
VSWGQPNWFWAFAAFPFLIGVFVRNEGRRVELLRRLVAPRLQDRLAGTVSIVKRRVRFALLLLALAAIVVSLAQPRLGFTWEESKRKGRDILIAIDVSKSMLSTDVAPNRLTRAKFAAQDLIAQLGGDRVGLIAFAGSAFLQAPLTADFGAVLNSLNELDTEIIPRGGTNLAEAIRVAVEAFGKGESDHRALIIFTDGEELDADGLQAAEKQKDALKIFGVGVGSADGSLIPVPGRSDFLKDESGQFVKSRLDEARLRKIAEMTGGFYVHLQNGPAEMTRIVRDGLSKMSEQDIDAKLSRQPIERYQWPLGAGIVLLIISMLLGERRRGVGRVVSRVAAMLAVLGGLGLATAAAESPANLYADGKFEDAQQAWQRLAEKNPKSGALAFNLGAAAYKNKDLDTALKAFSQALTTEDASLRAKAEYNLGNTLFQRGSAKKDIKTLEDALGHYGQSLTLTPEDANTLFNKKATEDLIAKLKEQQQQDKKQDQKKQGKKDEQQQKKDQQKSDSKDQQKGDPQEQKKDQDSQKGDEQKEQPGGDEKKDQPQSKPEDGKEKEGQQGEKKEQKDGQQEPQKQAQNGEPQDRQPAPGQEEAGKKPPGEVKANPSQTQEEKDGQEEAAAEELAAAEGKMTERQAKALLDSLKSEDDKVRLVDPNERKRAGRVLRDW